MLSADQRRAQLFWDAFANSFDDAPDHGLNDPKLLRSWTKLLGRWLPDPKSTVLDIGCGTGSLSLIAARLGHTVTGIDISGEMVKIARKKAALAGFDITFDIQDASVPALLPTSFDVLICRHVLWALPCPRTALGRWSSLLRAGGRVILIEGRWTTGVGITAAKLIDNIPPTMIVRTIENLSGDHEFWGGQVTDERYCIVADIV